MEQPSWTCALCAQPAEYSWDVLGKELSLCARCVEAQKETAFDQLWQEIYQGKTEEPAAKARQGTRTDLQENVREKIHREPPQRIVQHPWEGRKEIHPPLRWYDPESEQGEASEASEEQGVGSEEKREHGL